MFMTVRYTPGQLRDAVGISQETYRHWKKVLPPLRRRAGHGPRFTAGDLLAAAVVRILTVDFAIRVGAISLVAQALFETCNEPWSVLERGRLNVDLAAGALLFAQETESATLQTPVLVIPLQSSILDLRTALLQEPHDMHASVVGPPDKRIPAVPGTMEAGA